MIRFGKQGRRAVLAAAAGGAVIACSALTMATAQADEEDSSTEGGSHALEAEFDKLPAQEPGADGELVYRLTNAGETATEGILVNLTIPKGVTTDLDGDPHCQNTGSTDAGSELVSCNFSDDWGRLAPGQHQLAKRGFHISPDAPSDSDLGAITATAVPITHGEDGKDHPTEDHTDFTGDNTASLPIKTR